MPRTAVQRVCLCFASIIFTCVSLAAQSPQISMARRSLTVQPGNPPERGLVKIHSNLGSKTDAYDDGVAWQITGPGNPRWGIGYLAMPFTPKKNCTAKEVLIALGYIGGGQNKGSISIFNDANGVPGKPLKTWASGNFQQEGKCCKLVSLKDSVGISLRGGTKYWIVAATGSKSRQAQYAWNFVWNQAMGKVAFLNGNTEDKWLPYKDNLAAFAVYGTIP
jgi:hypothetical protein